MVIKVKMSNKLVADFCQQIF